MPAEEEKPESEGKEGLPEGEQPEVEEGGSSTEGEEEEVSESEEEEVSESEEETEPKRTPRLVEAYKFRIAEKKWQKEKKELEKRIRELESQLAEKTPSERSEEIKAVAEKYGLDEDFVRDLVKLAKSEPSTQQFQKELEALKEEREWERQYREFEKEYTDKIEPLLVQDGILEDKRPKFKSYLRDLAFTERFASWPLDDIYVFLKAKGHIEDFLPKEKKKSAEPSRGGARGREAKSLKEMIEGMSEEEFLKWGDEQAERESKYEIHRA